MLEATKTLYLDSAGLFSWGVFDSESETWLYFYQGEAPRESRMFFSMLEKELSNLKLCSDDIDQFVNTAGPGSYTGMRFSQGFGKILENFSHAKCLSFYCFEPLRYHDHEEPGLWFTNAFKNEVFIARFDQEADDFKKGLVSQDEFLEISSGYSQVYCLNKMDRSLFRSAKITRELLKENPAQYFLPILKEAEKRELLKPMYFRDLDVEFKVKS